MRSMISPDSWISFLTTARDRRLAALVRSAAGCLLVAAGLLKGHDLLSSGDATADLGLPRSAVALIAETEVALGAWLLSGRRAAASWLAGLTFFTVAAGASVLFALQGRPSCCCFGRYSLSPWRTAMLDVCLASALWRWRPASIGQRLNRLHGALGSARASFAVFGAGTALVLTAGYVARDPVAEAWPASVSGGAALAMPLRPVGRLDLGRVASGRPARLRFELLNESHERIRLARLESSCKCLSLALDGAEIGPAERATATAVFDNRSEPEFRGRLDVRVRGFGDANRPVLQTMVEVEVVD